MDSGAPRFAALDTSREGLSARAGSARLGDTAAQAELVCQQCGEVTWRRVPTRTDTMPACPACDGRRQIVRIRHGLWSRDRSGRLSGDGA
jgi:ribosomal protein L37AE/L43A